MLLSSLLSILGLGLVSFVSAAPMPDNEHIARSTDFMSTFPALRLHQGLGIANDGLDQSAELIRRQSHNASSESDCRRFSCTLGGNATFNTHLDACSCPKPHCAAKEAPKCRSTLQLARFGSSSTCTCVKACSEQDCPFNSVPLFNQTTRTCVCPALPTSCNIACPFSSTLQYDESVEQCFCESVAQSTATQSIPVPLPVQTGSQSSPNLHNEFITVDVTTKIKMGMAQVYSIIADFTNNNINFTIMLPGSVDGFQMTASATFYSDDIGNNPEPILVMSPAHVPPSASTRQDLKRTTSGQHLVQIIAVHFNVDMTATFHCQLVNGTIVRLTADGFVQSIDLMDPTAPPELTITTSLTSSLTKRSKERPAPRPFPDMGPGPYVSGAHRSPPTPSTTFPPLQVLGALQPSQTPTTILPSQSTPETCFTKCPSGHQRSYDSATGICACETLPMESRGIQDVNAYNTIASQEVCAAMLCTGTGVARPAMFNPYRTLCYCQLPPDQLGSTEKRGDVENPQLGITAKKSKRQSLSDPGLLGSYSGFVNSTMIDV